MTGHKLPSTISRGILNLPSDGVASKVAAERLLAQDRELYHCYFNKMGFHNHLSHHILAAFDLGAPAGLLQAIYNDEEKDLTPIHVINRDTGEEKELDVQISEKNFTQYLEADIYYASFLKFYTEEIERLGVEKTLEKYIFSPAFNGNGAQMLMRLISGAVHPFIQVGYALEFNSAAMVAQGLAMASVTKPALPHWPSFSMPSGDFTPNSAENINANQSAHRQPSVGRSILSILREAYDSPAFAPPMPYDPDALLSKRLRDSLVDGRFEELQRLAALWTLPSSPTNADAEFAARAEELIFVSTLLFAGTGKPGRKPRLDFFLMHILNSALFLPSYIRALTSAESKARVLNAHFVGLLQYMLVRGRPRIDPALLMSYPAFPRPPGARGGAEFSKDAIGRPEGGQGTSGSASDKKSASTEGDTINPWPAMLSDVLHAPDSHTVKALRVLYYAARTYGDTPPGGAIGAFEREGKETHRGAGEMDGSIFVRAAGVLMNNMGWVTHGQSNGSWDRSALGWDDAWKGGE